MPDVRVTIDGKEASVPRHYTILEAARQMGIDIPTLCDHPVIKPIGACRMCLVEVEKQRVLQPACTFPVSEGMVVKSESPQVVASRRFVLQLLFSERNHYCMFCQMSGSCELQNLAYRYGLDHWIYNRPFPKLPVDASRKYFAVDHNRCILCRRCIRACDEQVGNNTLGLKHRGTATMVIADMDVPFGESSCVSCGTCLQVCPTGALMDRASAYMGATKEITRVKTHCTACSVGCGEELIVRENRVIRVEGDWDAEPNRGLLCDLGRFTPLYERRQRVRKPLLRGQNGLVEASLEQALQEVAAKLKAAGGKACTVVSGLASTEAAKAAVEQLPGEKALLEGAPSGEACKLSVLDEADVYIVVNTDLTKDYQVAGFALKRGVRHRGARLMLIGQGANGLDDWASRKWSPGEAQKAVEIAQDAQKPVIIYGAQGAVLASELAKALPKASLVAFTPASNTFGVVSAGISAAFAPNGAKAYYVLAGEAAKVDQALLEALKTADFVAVQASYREPWEEVADVILPSPTAFEKSGTMINAEGRVCQLNVGVKSKLVSEVEIVERLGALL